MNYAGNMAMETWQIIRTAHNTLKAHLDRLLDRYGLSTERYAVVEAIKDAGGSARVSDVAKTMTLSSNAASSMLIDRMVKDKLILRKRDKTDRRVVWVSNSKKVEAKFDRAAPAVVEFLDSYLAELKPDTRKLIIECLKAVLQDEDTTKN